MTNYSENNGFLKGAVVGGVLGGIAALLLSPKSGQELRQDIMDGYSTVSDKTNDLKCKSQNLFCSRKDAGFLDKKSTIVVGSLLGGVIGAIAALLLAPESGKTLREKFGDHFDEIRDKAEEFIEGIDSKGHEVLDHVEDWKDTLAFIVQKLSKKGKKQANSAMDEIMDWASLGLRVFDQIQKRR